MNRTAKSKTSPTGGSKTSPTGGSKTSPTGGQPGVGDPLTRVTRPALGRLIALRFLLVVVSLAIIVTRQVGRPLVALLLDPPTIVLLACMPLNLIYWLLWHRGTSDRGPERLQTVVDLGLASLLVYLTGGVASNLRFLYFAPILASSSFFRLSGGVLCASAATISVAVVTLAHFFAFRYNFALPLVSVDWRPTFSQTMLRPQLLMLFGQAVSFYLVAVLSGTLAVRLRQVRILNEEILERLAEGVLTIDRDGRVVFLNRRAHELLRVPFRQATTGRPWQEISPSHLIEPLGRVVEQILRRAVPISADFDFETEFTPVGLRTPLPTQVVSAPLGDDRGRLRGVTVVFIDLSERKRMESALRQAERLEALNQAAAGIAHEIRNPIASIRASAQELLEHGGPETTGDTPRRQNVRARLLRVLILESDRLNHIVSDFMTYAQLRPPADETFPLTDVLEHVVTLLERAPGPTGGWRGQLIPGDASLLLCEVPRYEARAGWWSWSATTGRA